MKDNEIIKALECCMQDDTPLEAVCYHCPIKQDRPNCVRKLSSNSLDLINRQRAEIAKKSENFGKKNVFLTKEEAEEVLKRKEAEGK